MAKLSSSIIKRMASYDTTRRCNPNHYTFHSFYNELDQFHYSDISPNLVELDNE
jgi:hypothetical protein